MSMIWNRPRNVVRLASAARAPILVCLLAFGLTAIVVYRWGRESWIPISTKPVYTATACVVQRQVEGSVGTRIPFEYTDDARERAVEVANAQTERYVRDRRAEWTRRTEGPCRQAKANIEKARQEHAEAVARLEAFQRELAEAAANVQRKEAMRLPRPADNPQWLDLHRRFTDLQRRYDELLVERTVLHPAVVDVALRMATIKEQLDVTPQRRTSVGDELPVRIELPSEDSAPTEADQRIAEQNQRKLDELTQAVDRAAQAIDDATAAQQRAIQAQQAGPKFFIEPAQVVEIPPRIDYGWRRLMSTTFATGLLMMFGVGFVAIGRGIEPRVASVAEVEADLGVPLVGMIPADDPAADPAAASRRQSRDRRTMISVGTLLMLLCGAVAIWGVTGI